jgi:sugar/nucleoside kinase (ribokinase family)
MSITVVGSVAFDTVRTPYGSAENVLGGSASYFGLAARHFSEVHLVAVVGEDFPAEEEEMLRNAGIDLRGLEKQSGRTFRWGGEYGPDLADRETLFTELNVFGDFHPRLSSVSAGASTVFLANIHPSLQHEVLDQISQPRLTAVDTMNLWIETERDAVLALLRRVDLVLLSDEEARLLSGEIQLPRAGRKILEMGAHKLIIKKGENGALFFSPEERFFCPAYPLEDVVDPTGAGDAFAGGLVGYLDHVEPSEHPPLRAAMICGTALASFGVEAFSPRRLLEVSRDQIAERIDAIRELTLVPKVPLWQTNPE